MGINNGSQQATYYVAFMHAYGHGHTTVTLPAPITGPGSITSLHEFLTAQGITDPTVINFIRLETP
ncbi:hypothetical protein GCM10010123_18110 [Pilimelia anulata]|uniref:Uncharacterized protein n=1 Tax=Pilimelia anulata TaxID=53371 RepID=A0A8J3B2Y0_9ACTN|nr:hypothetical protein [Pilimelia anulata]GGJ88890.1 hypothetical protein GCM10010123_18110 [Pilimelia anulata]